MTPLCHHGIWLLYWEQQSSGRVTAMPCNVFMENNLRQNYPGNSSPTHILRIIQMVCSFSELQERFVAMFTPIRGGIFREQEQVSQENSRINAERKIANNILGLIDLIWKHDLGRSRLRDTHKRGGKCGGLYSSFPKRSMSHLKEQTHMPSKIKPRCIFKSKYDV